MQYRELKADSGSSPILNSASWQKYSMYLISSYWTDFKRFCLPALFRIPLSLPVHTGTTLATSCF